MVETVNIALPAATGVLIIILMVWTMVWTAIALWKSARNNQIAWFVVMFILSTVGILEIIYLAFFQRNRNKELPVVVKEVKAPKKKRSSKKKTRKKSSKKKKK